MDNYTKDRTTAPRAHDNLATYAFMMYQMPPGTDASPQADDALLSDEASLSLGSMEGLYELPVIAKAGTAQRTGPARSFAGQWSVGLIATLAYALHYLPVAPFRIAGEHGFRRPISAAILAILLGLTARALGWVPISALDGCKRLVKKLMPVLIVLTGAGLNLASFSAIGVEAFGITLGCIAVSCAASIYFGRLFGAWPKTSMLIGAGTAICGTSAIIAAAPVIQAEDEDITISVGTVNVLGLLLMLCFPLLGGLLHMPDDAFGVWAGTSIHAVPQVVAAGFAYSERAATVATLVKLVRVTLLAPFLVVLVLVYARRSGTGTSGFELRLARVVPPFLWGFLCLAVLGTVQLIPTLEFHLAGWMPGAIRDFQIPLAGVLVDAGNVLLTIVMAAMGLEVNLRTMSEVGRPALFTGLAACVVLSAFSLLLIHLLL